MEFTFCKYCEIYVHVVALYISCKEKCIERLFLTVCFVLRLQCNKLFFLASSLRQGLNDMIIKKSYNYDKNRYKHNKLKFLINIGVD